MRRSTVFLMLAIVAAFLASVVVFSALRKRERALHQAMAREVSIVVAARDIAIGERIEPSMVKLARWSADSVPSGAFTKGAAVANSYARTELFAGEPIVRQGIVSSAGAKAVMPLLIPRGMRAMSVPVDAVSDVAGFVQPHTRVDVLVALTGNGPTGKALCKIVLQDVQVIAVAQEINPGQSKPKVVKVVTLLVTPQQAEKLGLAQREGTLRLAMRNYDDRQMVRTSGVDLAELLGRSTTGSPVTSDVGQQANSQAGALPPGRRYSIEIMRNGKQRQTVSFVNGGLLALHASQRRTTSFTDARQSTGSVEAASAPAANSRASDAAASYAPNLKAIQIP